MKKTILLLIFLSSLNQSWAQYKIELGVEGGPGSTFLRGNDIINKTHEPVLTFTGGFTLKYNVTKNISLRTGICYERKGSRVQGAFIDSFGEHQAFSIRNDFHYVTVPLLCRVSFGKKIQGFINVGPYVSYLFKEMPVYKSGPPPTNDPLRPQTENFTLLDLGISAGAGFSVPIADRISFSAEIRNNLGLSNISARPVINYGTIKTNAAYLLIGFSYKFLPHP